MNREVREVRPYRVDTSLTGILDEAVLRFGTEECEAGGRIQVDDPDDFRRRRAELRWSQESGAPEKFQQRLLDGAAAAGIEAEALGLLITTYTSYLKRAEVVFRYTLSDGDLPNPVTLSDPRPAALRAGLHRSAIDVYLLLDQNLPHRVLRPWRKGTWLANVRFRLSSSSSASWYRLQPLTDRDRDELGLPKGAVRYVELGDHEPLEPYDATDLPTFWVDGDLLSSLAARSQSKASRSIQTQLVHDFVWAVISSPTVIQSDDLDTLAWADLKESSLGRIARFAARKNATPARRDEMIQLIRSDPSRFMTLVEDAIGLRKAALEAVGEDAG